MNASIMLPENLWVERQLSNGSMVAIRDIVWEVDAHTPTQFRYRDDCVYTWRSEGTKIYQFSCWHHLPALVREHHS